MSYKLPLLLIAYFPLPLKSVIVVIELLIKAPFSIIVSFGIFTTDVRLERFLKANLEILSRLVILLKSRISILASSSQTKNSPMIVMLFPSVTLVPS